MEIARSGKGGRTGELLILEILARRRTCSDVGFRCTLDVTEDNGEPNRLSCDGVAGVMSRFLSGNGSGARAGGGVAGGLKGLSGIESESASTTPVSESP